MSRVFSTLRPHIRTAFSLGGLFIPSAPSSTSAVPQLTRDPSKTKYIIRTPPSNPPPPREVPTPLVFVSAEGWDADSSRGMESFSAMYAEKGYTCLEIDIAPPETRPESGKALMKHFEDELRQHIRLLSIPFAPVLISRGSGTLIAQTFVESNPASGLVLISPPPSNDSLSAPSSSSSPPTSSSSSFSTDSVTSSSALLPTPLPEFKYEPLFPIAILSSPSHLSTLRAQHRLLQPRPEGTPKPAPPRNRLLGGMFGRGGRGEWQVDVIEVPEGGEDGQSAFVGIERWLDKIGV